MSTRQFSIIIPTYKRPAELLRAVKSVQAQSFPHWEMIVVNDNPYDGATEAVSTLADSRMRILENDTNRGVNYSRNRGLDSVAPTSNWVIFLDDDDMLAPEALTHLSGLVTRNDVPWIVTARGSDSTTPTTIGTGKKKYSYLWDYLIFRRFKGDATHCISTALINNPRHPLRFPSRIKQAEEWLFYCELSTHTRFYYDATVTTLTPGYTATGLNYRTRTLGEQLWLIPTIIREAHGRSLYLSPAFWIYVTMRIIRAFVK